MSKPDLLLIGAGGHSHSCIDIIEQHGEFNIAGLVGLPEELQEEHMGYSVIASDQELPQLAKEYQYALISVGQIASPAVRFRLYREIVGLGFKLPTIISPSACISSHAVCGRGTVIMHGVIVNAGAKIGNNCIINSQALIEHDVFVGSHSHISTGTIVNGSVCIGDGCFIGSGSIIKQGVSIGKNCVIGMGVAVKTDQEQETLLSKNVSP